MCACIRLSSFCPGIAEDALFRFTCCPVIVWLFVRACAYTEPPCAAGILINEDYAVFSSFIYCAGRTCCDTTWVQAVIANSRHIEVEELMELGKHLLLRIGKPFEVRVV